MAKTVSKTIRFYKYVTPPKDDTAVIVGNKTIAGTNFTSTISALNSLGATVNSLGVMMKGIRNNQIEQAEDARRNAQLIADQSRETALEGKDQDGGAGKVIKNIAKGGIGFLGHLWKMFKKLALFGALNWLSDEKNREKIQKIVKRVGNFLKWMVDTFTSIAKFIGDSWDKTFGEGKTFMQRLEGASKLLGAAGLGLLGLGFLTNPLGTIKNFTSILGAVGKGILNMGKFLGGNRLGRFGLALGQGVAAYQEISQDESIPEEDRQAAAIGGSTGATVGSIAGGEIGAKFLGPIGGLIGSALGGFLGKHAGKFLGPVVQETFEKIKVIFDKVMEFVGKVMEPIMAAIQDFFKALGPAIDKAVDFIKPHLPKIMEIGNIIGKVAFAPLILLFKGLTKLLKMIPSKQEIEGVKAEQDKAEGKSIGGAVQAPKMVPYPNLPTLKIPQFSKGGWIHGPQSGYPVSMSGKGIDFIGHGTEYVARRSSGGFVIPFDTPHTRRDPGLTSRRIGQAKAGGYKVPGFSKGGPVVNPPVYNLHLPSRSLGGFVKNTTKTMIKANPLAAVALKAAEPHVKNAGSALVTAFTKVKEAANEATGGALDGAIEAMVAQAIKAPPSQTGPVGGGPETPIIQDVPRNPASQFLVSRFGRSAESNNPVSNFL